MNTFVWLIRREFWENRAIWVIPCVIGALAVLASLFGNIELDALASPGQNQVVGQGFFVVMALIFFAVMSIYTVWYLLDCLYADRKDRSVLFWKSLPISDTATVLAKLATAVIVIPLVYFVAADVTTLLTAFVVSVRIGGLGGTLWRADLWLQVQALWLYVIVVTAIWYLPFTGWLLLVSAWAKRAVMLWSILPLLTVCLIEYLFRHSGLIAHQILVRLLGFPTVAFHVNDGKGSWTTTSFAHDNIATPANIWSFFDARGFFSSPQTWIGLALGIVLIVGAIQLRLRRTEI
jgi:ABC-2 type transport system permease protein